MKIMLGAAGAVLVVLVGTLAWMGAFTPLHPSEENMGPYPFVYAQAATADPKEIGRISEELGKRLVEAGYVDLKPAQVFYPQDRGIQNQIGFVTDRAVLRETLGNDNYFRPVPSQQCVVIRFPFRNALSFAIGAMRADGVFSDYRKLKKYANTSVMVILDRGTIFYLQPIEPA